MAAANSKHSFSGSEENRVDTNSNKTFCYFNDIYGIQVLQFIS